MAAHGNRLGSVRARSLATLARRERWLQLWLATLLALMALSCVLVPVGATARDHRVASTADGVRPGWVAQRVEIDGVTVELGHWHEVPGLRFMGMRLYWSLGEYRVIGFDGRDLVISDQPEERGIPVLREVVSWPLLLGTQLLLMVAFGCLLTAYARTRREKTSCNRQERLP